MALVFLAVEICAERVNAAGLDGLRCENPRGIKGFRQKFATLVRLTIALPLVAGLRAGRGVPISGGDMEPDFTPAQRPDPDAAQFEAAARRSLARLQPEFRDRLSGLVVRIEEFARPDQLASVDLSNRWDLTGLYEGTPLPEQSVWDHAPMPPVISLFRQPLLREMRETGIGFDELVHHVVIHEAGHHFGFSDEDMHALEEIAPE
ncbi:metallopeptidase family protein [Qipengyuania sp. ASV99]|uniref:metallopeptidase family protein n=1 Tax=Qipengyuania sp. ASV99 TaxID=3399681 RepID=UPI003A4C594D